MWCLFNSNNLVISAALAEVFALLSAVLTLLLLLVYVLLAHFSEATPGQATYPNGLR